MLTSESDGIIILTVPILVLFFPLDKTMELSSSDGAVSVLGAGSFELSLRSSPESFSSISSIDAVFGAGNLEWRSLLLSEGATLATNEETVTWPSLT